MEESVITRAPLTFGQLSLWRSIQGLPPVACNVPQVWLLPSGATVALVERALEALERRHESLRTRYERAGAHGLVQAVWESAAVSLEVVEAGSEPDKTAEAAVQRLTIDPFDLAEHRPWRACMVTCEGGPARLVMCFHHIAVDAWAINQLKEELLAILDGRFLPASAPNNRDLAMEQWSPAKENRRKAARTYWRRIFESAPAMEKESESELRTTRWARLSSEAAAEAAGRIAARVQISVPSVILTACCLALGERTGRDRLLIAVYANNRTDPRLEALVASQTQIVPLLVRLDPQEEFDVLARRIHWETVRSYQHGSYNVDDVLEIGREYGYTGSVNGSFEGSVSGFFCYFFNYLGQYQEDRASPRKEIETGTTGRNIGAPLYFQVQDGRALTCTLRENSASDEFDILKGLLFRLRDIILSAANNE